MHNPAFRLFSDHHDAPSESRVDASPRRNYNDTGISTELDIPVLNLDAWRDTSFSVHEYRSPHIIEDSLQGFSNLGLLKSDASREVSEFDRPIHLDATKVCIT
ncbi:hypothetical protein KCV07_g10098, partial [Aureobasidium melanogenum]